MLHKMEQSHGACKVQSKMRMQCSVSVCARIRAAGTHTGAYVAYDISVLQVLHQFDFSCQVFYFVRLAHHVQPFNRKQFTLYHSVYSGVRYGLVKHARTKKIDWAGA